MSFPRYALFYFPESDIVKVDSTDIILTQHRRAEHVVNSREQFKSEEGYVEVRLPSRSRHGPTKTLPAKILALSDVHKELIVKREAFKRGEDIWKKTTQQGEKKAVKVASSSQGAADVAMGEKLKRDLQCIQRKKTAPVTSTPMSDDSDNTEIDMFENEQRRSRKRAALDSDNEQDENDGREESENSLLQSTSPQDTVKLDGDVVKALKELPGIVASLKDVLESMKRGSYSSSFSSSEGSLAESSEMISLAESDVKVPKRMFDRLNKSRVSLFTQDLATLIFGKDKLARCTLTGKSGIETKEQLDPHKVTVLIDTVIKQFPNTTVSEVRSLIRRKCNNESNSKNSRSPLEG